MTQTLPFCRCDGCYWYAYRLWRKHLTDAELSFVESVYWVNHWGNEPAD